ncbi:HalOD1 output domain-containing protein [Natronolimnohabitans innermongolicus]|uniref:Halobacterial output domain-containing protein n=1 Tax=Natronolimnohabitans innermongolicus JCM 12255 TaxID=1227499 RepID=L9WUX1_9EURY|nr:HalOD1 output domain-containing protein [Natronolimnohabitans innermongolicus]ELY53217.1 hypothetical protein C493_14343 [Natronolimnohabitans innermongolicus JCM 12255]
MDRSAHSIPLADDAIVTRVQRYPDESVLEVVVRALTAIDGHSSAELEPLYERVDPEALAALLEHADRCGADVAVEFAVDEYGVVVRRDGTVYVHEAESTLV